MDKELLATAGHKLKRAERIYITSHVRPDGDAIGSILGMGLSLLEAGKVVEMALADGVPAGFRHLPGADLVRTRPDGHSDLWVVLDSSDLERVGNAAPKDGHPDLNIDHHVTNLNFAKINLVDTKAVATAAILAESLPAWGYAITAPVAEALLTGIITDTLGFRTTNMTSKAMRIAAKLMDRGAQLPELYTQALVLRTFEALRYWSYGLNRLQRQGGLVWTSLTQEDRNTVGYPGRDDAELINLLSAIKDCDIAVIFIEQQAGRVKVSWRATSRFDVSKVALRFMGGGHPAAAGAMIEGDLASVQRAVLSVTQKFMASTD